MTNLKTTLITAVAGLGISLGGLALIPEAAQARECSYGDGFSVCFDFVSRRGTLTGWLVDFENNHTKEELNIICDGKRVADWNSKGGLSQSEADGIATWFCSL